MRRLRVLREVARHHSFSAAAHALGYTQPAVSRQIATLEAESGVTLVRRQPHGVHLTDAGAVLLRHAEAIFARIDDAEDELRALAGLQAGRLRLATFASAAASVVPLAIARFRDEHPAVELSVAMAEAQDALPRVKAGELDLALSNHAEEADGDALVRVHLFDDPMYVALPTGHPLAERATVRLRHLAGEAWMLGTTRTCPDSRLFIRACHEAGFEPRIAFENDDYNAILGFVAAGVGVALIPDVVVRSMREDVLVRSLGPGAPVRQIVAVLPRGYRPPAAQAMLEILQEVCSAWAAGRDAQVPA